MEGITMLGCHIDVIRRFMLLADHLYVIPEVLMADIEVHYRACKGAGMAMGGLHQWREHFGILADMEEQA